MPSEAQRGWLNHTNRDYYGGALMLAVGASAAYQSTTYHVGTLSHMGPGYFPLLVSIVLACMGALMMLGARRAGLVARDEPYQPPEWRGWACIVIGLIAFLVVGRYGGLLPASFAVVFIAALGDRQNTFKSAFVLATAMVAIAAIVFWWALRLQFPLFRWG